jgi:PAS domain S-box-containing protein
VKVNIIPDYRLRLIIASVFAGLFIVSSLYLLGKVNQLQDRIAYQVKKINTLQRVQDESYQIYTRLLSHSELDATDLSQQLDQLASLVHAYPDLSILSDRLIEAKVHAYKDNNINRNEITDKLDNVISNSKSAIQSSRKELGNYSATIAKLWTYTHLLVLIACALCIILIIAASRSIRIRKDLTQLKERNQLLIENSANCIITSDEDGKIKQYNRAAQSLFGYTKKEVKGKGYEMLYDNHREYQKVKQKLATEGIFKGEVMNKRKDGNRFISYLTANVIHDNKGKVIGSLGISRDITEEKERQQEYQNIIDDATDVIYKVDVDGNCTFVNDAARVMMGYTQKDLIGKHFSTIIFPEDQEMVAAFYLHQWERRLSETYLEFRAVKKSGKVIWVGQTVKMLYSQTDPNTILGFQGMVRNINEQKQTELKLKESEKNLRTIAETIDDLFYLYNCHDHKYEYLSNNCEDVLGVSREYLMNGGSFNSEIVIPEDQPKAKAAEKRLMAGDSINEKYRIEKNGEIRWINEKSSPIRNKDGKITQLSGVFRDITKDVEFKTTIARQHKEIGKSLSYAKNMQENMLLDLEMIKKSHPELFVFFQPKEELSGDFFIVENMQSASLGDILIVAVADCTGNGVPAGMLSFLCNSILKESFILKDVKTPAEALEYVREKLLILFKFDEQKHIFDAMDVGLCLISSDQHMYFAGANMSLMILRDGEVKTIKGDRQQVGYNFTVHPFTDHELSLNQGDCLYLFTDGFYSQFGGPKGKKMMKKGLQEFLSGIQEKNMQEQHIKVKDFFNEWKGMQEQLDDATLAGVKI